MKGRGRGPETLFAVESVVVRHVRLELRAPFVTALGVEEQRDIVVVEVHGEGVVGYGEAPVLSAPTYNAETAATAWHVLNDFFVARLLKRPETTPQDVAERLAVFEGHAFAKAALEGAVWDATAKRAGVPLARRLAGASGVEGVTPRRRVAAGVVVGMEAEGSGGDGELLRRVEARLAEGYRRVKIKIAPGRDEGPLRAVRRTFGDVPLSVDANGAYRRGDEAALRRLDAFGLQYIEQPLPADDIVDHAALQRRLATPLCLDESLDSVGRARQALQLASCRTANVKASRLGGLTAALAVHDLCREAGVSLLCGGLLETGIGRAHNVALAALPGFTLPGDLSASDRYWRRDVVHPPFSLDAEGFLPTPDGPGIGVQVDAEFLERLTVRRRAHRA